MVFHNGNAYEEDGKIVVDSVLCPDGSILDLLATWSRDRPQPAARTVLTRLVVDPARGSVDSRTALAEGLEYPRYDPRLGGRKARYLYYSEWGGREDQLAFDAVTRYDFERKAGQRVSAGKGRTFGEPVFVPHPGQTAEDRGWLLTLGYDAVRDQSFVEIRDAGTMDFEARVWTGNHFPLGFHGNFYDAA
jgi:all-trans-8'-apo-beta-carotenal 15,15'-oxygenase